MSKFDGGGGYIKNQAESYCVYFNKEKCNAGFNGS